MNKSDLENPFVGLRPYNQDDSCLYFGRMQQTQALLSKLHEHRLVVVTGSSGSGKSSLVHAGVIPKLQAGFLVQDRDQWFIASLKPGNTPLENFLRCIHDSVNPEAEYKHKERKDDVFEKGVQAVLEYLNPYLDETDNSLFILIDQFEELFRFAHEKINQNNKAEYEEAYELVNLLLGLAEQRQCPIYICLTMRSDFLGDCDIFHGLPEAINRGQFLVPRLTRWQREEVIVNAIQFAGAKITSRLIDRLLNENMGFRDDLPVFQHALMRTFAYWQQCDGEFDAFVDIEHYEQIGSVHTALNKHADEIYAELKKPQQKYIAKTMFQCLTSIDSSNRKIRRPARFSEVQAVCETDASQLRLVVDHFRGKERSFLVLSSKNTSDDCLIDISHESLIRQWKTLMKWIDEESESATTLRRLSVKAYLHYDNDNAGSDL